MESRHFRLSLMLALSTVRVGADTYPRQPAIDAQHYTFHLILRDDTNEIAGDATVQLCFLQSGTREFSLDLASASSEAGMTVTEVTSPSGGLRYKHANDRLTITIDTLPVRGERRAFRVQYHGIPANGLRIISNKFGERTFFSENWPNKAHEWLPMIDHPYDKATSEFIVTAPAKYQVVSNGLLLEQTDAGDGQRLTHWKQSVPIASWLNAIGVARFSSRHFATIANIPLQTWVYSQERENGIVVFDQPAIRALEFYRDHIGTYPYEKLANVQAAGISGGTEHASAIFYGEKSVGDKPATNLVAHEIAHQWFGDSVTEKDWDDVWLSEGFATYFTLLCTEHDEGRDAFVAGLKHSRDIVFDLEKKMPGVPVLHDNLSDMKNVLNQIIYQKGGWTLHMLRALIGTESFWAGIRDYYQRYRDSNASTDDFREVMEEHGHTDLRWFFDQWLRRPGSPSVEGTWTYDATSRKLRIELTQIQPGGTYRLPLEVGLQGAAGQARIEKIELSEKHQTFEIPSPQTPSSVVLDPNTWVLMKTHFTKK
jgi:aminopeptidase N